MGLSDGYNTGTWQKSTPPSSTIKNTRRWHKGAGFSAIRLDFNEPQWTFRPLSGTLSWPIPATPHLLWLQPNEPLRSRGTHRFSTSAAPLHTDDFIYAGPRWHDGRSIWQLVWHLLKLAVLQCLLWHCGISESTPIFLFLFKLLPFMMVLFFCIFKSPLLMIKT